ncbi:MAG TPA: hypothetical protein PLM82_08090 [Candidatus Latescibacteria bacterium]|nr:hypothetical protein [Candidatus Latescibacterota bacterium]
MIVPAEYRSGLRSKCIGRLSNKTTLARGRPVSAGSNDELAILAHAMRVRHAIDAIPPISTTGSGCKFLNTKETQKKKNHCSKMHCFLPD